MTVVPAGVLVGVPLVLLVLGLPARRMALLIAGALAALLTFQGAVREGLWYVERGWAILVGGWFLALTLRWPRSGVTARGLGAVGGAAAVAAAFLAVDRSRWAVLDWVVGERIRSLSMAGVSLFRRPEEPMPAALVGWARAVAEGHAAVFPAALGLASLAGVALAWWIWATLSRQREPSEALGPVREFRFNDHLVWLFIVGLVLVLTGGEGALGRVGWNAVVFMGGLYVLRGFAVALFVSGGLSCLGAVALAMALVLLWPMIVPGAAMIGLGDTWLGIRERRRENLES